VRERLIVKGDRLGIDRGYPERSGDLEGRVSLR
jgi:hypothetical protein